MIRSLTDWLYDTQTQKLHLKRKYSNNIHYVYSDFSKDDPIVILHGLFSSSFSFLELASALSNQHQVFVMDLPGWGVSEGLNRHDGDADDIIQQYIECIKQFIHLVTRKKVILIAHSFSGFLAVHFAKKYPNLISNLVLVSPAGLFPLSSSTGMYWAVFFYTTVHYYIVYYLRWILLPIVFILTSRPLVRFSFVQLSSHLPAFQIIRAFFHIDLWSAYWKYPCVHDLIQLQIPTSMIYGSSDNVTPAHNGEAIQKVTFGRIVCIVMDGVWHNPHLSTTRFKQILKSVLQNMTRSPVFRDTVKYLPKMYQGVWSISKTKQHIQHMYQDFFALFNQ